MQRLGNFLVKEMRVINEELKHFHDHITELVKWEITEIGLHIKADEEGEHIYELPDFKNAKERSWI